MSAHLPVRAGAQILVPHPKVWTRERRPSARALAAWRVPEMALSLFIHLFIHL